jgi:cobalt/nickel transport system ATP-binding protein
VRERVAETAASLRLEKVLDRAPYTLSGGEKKRVAIGAIVTMRPRVLLLDEPTNALDPRSQVWLLELLAEWKSQGRTVVLSTHDLSAAEESCERMVVLSEEHRIVADGTPEEVLAQRDLLLGVNLIHEHSHRHEHTEHQHPHEHGHLHA